MCGKDSKRWRKTVEPVMKFYEEVEEVIHHRRESLVMLERQNKLSMNDDGANNSKYTVREDLSHIIGFFYHSITAPFCHIYINRFFINY